MSESREVPRPRAENSGASAPPSATGPEGSGEPDPVPDHGGLLAPTSSSGGSGPRTPATGGSREVRASGSEREATVRFLHRALGEGRIDLSETETRTVAAYAAVHRSDLSTLLSDLPSDGEVAESELKGVVPPDWRELWVATVWRARASAWDRPGLERSVPPDAGQQRLAAALLALAALWLLAWAVIGAVL